MSNLANDPTLAPPARPTTPSTSGDATLTATRTATDFPATVPTAPPGYTIERELGRGGMGVVYLAHQLGLNRPVALKMVLAGGSASPQELVRFLGEAEAIAQLHHPNVVQIHEVGSHGGVPYFTLEYCAGGALDAKLSGDPLGSSESARLIEAVARGVHAAHARGIVHRDLKPHNILLAADGTPKVTDFGVAKRLGAGSDLTQTGAVMGTPSYMAPEQAAGKGKAASPAADVYSLGALLYETLTGRPPFKAATPLDTLLLVVSAEPIPPRQLNPRTPTDLETICLKCLQKDPAKRYVTAGELADDLHRFATGQPIVARPVSALERGWRWVKRNPLLAAVLVGGPVLLAVTTVAVLIAWLMTAAANVRLAGERMKAHTEQEEAEHQRALAHARLEKAIEAVEKMMTRVASERWATSPELREERRQVLEDAVAFFNGLTEEDSADPLVRKEAAKAHTRVAGAYLMLGDLKKAEAASREAIRLYEALAAEFPDDPDYPAAASEAYSLAGGTHALNGQFTDALAAYTRAVQAADTALAMNPESADYKLRSVEARSSLGFFYLQADRAKGEAVVEPMLRHAREIGSEPAARFEYRVALAFALCVAATFDLTAPGRTPAQTLSAASAKYDESAEVLDGLSGRSAPTARAWDWFAHTRAMVAVQRAFIAVQRAATPDARGEAVKQMQDGLRLYDVLLRVNPKSFPYLLQKYQALRMLATVCQMSNDKDGAARATADADRLIEAMVSDNPHLVWLRAMDGTRQAYLLVGRLRDGDPFEFEPAAEQLAATARSARRPALLYDVACVYAVAAGKRTSKADKLAAKAVALLNELAAGEFFKLPGKVKHMDDDADLDALRGRDDFKAFLEKVKPPADPPKAR